MIYADEVIVSHTKVCATKTTKRGKNTGGTQPPVHLFSYRCRAPWRRVASPQ